MGRLCCIISAQAIRKGVNMKTKIGLAVLAPLVALAAYAVLGAETSRADSTYDPATEARFCNAMSPTFVDPAIAGNPACAEDLSGGTAADFWTRLDMSSSTDLHFSGVTTFAPSGSTINPGSSITTGAKIGGHRYQVTVGLSNSICNLNLNVETVLYNVALPSNAADPRASTNIGWPRTDGATDRFRGWTGSVDGDHSANAGAGHYAIGGGGTVVAFPPRAVGSSVAVQNYPIWLLDMFDPDFTPGNFDAGAGPVTGSDGPLDPILPTAVYGGVTRVVGVWTPVYLAQFAPGALSSLGGAQALMNANMGWPSVAVTNDPTSVKASPSTVTDFCTPLDVETVLLGTAIGSGTRATTPGTAGTHFVTQRSTSVRDLDQDGFENAIDTCPTLLSSDPRAPSGTDTDSDGIDNIAGCDATVVAVVDEDGDGVQNRGDNCPFVSNPDNKDSEVSSIQADLGPSADTIGDACDSGVVTVASQNGHGPFTVTLSTAVANGRYHIAHNVIPKCFGGLTDADGDGYCGAADNDDTPGARGFARHTKWGATHPGTQMDTDGDRHSDAAETYFGTDPVFACSADSGANNEPMSHWPLDPSDNRFVNTFDIIPFIVALNHHIGEQGMPFPIRQLDFNLDGFINTFDVVPYITTLNKTCDAPLSPSGLGFTPWSQQ